MTRIISYRMKSPYGHGFCLTNEGKSFIDKNYETLSYNKLKEITGVSQNTIISYIKSQNYKKRKTCEENKKFKEKIFKTLKPYNKKLSIPEMAIVLKNNNINIKESNLRRILKESNIKTNYGLSMIRVFKDGNKNNLSPNNIILVNQKEFDYLVHLLPIEDLKNDVLDTALKLVRLRIIKNNIKEVYKAYNIKTKETVTAPNKSKLSIKMFKNANYINEAKKINENTFKISNWIITRNILK